MIVNPPYGERLVPDKLLQVYKDLGARLKHAFQGNVAWVISNNYDCFDQIGLKASARIPLFNGDLDCEFRKYELFQGKYKGFRDEGNALNKVSLPDNTLVVMVCRDGDYFVPKGGAELHISDKLLILSDRNDELAAHYKEYGVEDIISFK